MGDGYGGSGNRRPGGSAPAPKPSWQGKQYSSRKVWWLTKASSPSFQSSRAVVPRSAQTCSGTRENGAWYFNPGVELVFKVFQGVPDDVQGFFGRFALFF